MNPLADLVDLISLFCGAANRPGVTYVEPLQDGTNLCQVCGKSSKPEVHR